ncbi:MAG: carboxy terminal-processing peptidase [Bacteroidota bacterium]
MHRRFPYLFSGILFLSIFFAAVSPKDGGTQPEKEALIAQTIFRNLERYHFDPADLNDNFSAEAFNYYLNDIDGARLFFTEEDMQQLNGYRDQLDNQALAGNFEFFDKVQEMVVANRAETQTWYRELLAKPFNLKKKGKITMRGEASDWTENKKELRKYWEAYLQRDLLRRIDNKINELEKKREKELQSEDAEVKAAAQEPVPTAKELEADIRADMLKTYDKWYERMAKLKRSQNLSQYLNALTSVFDPHTSYYRPRDKENFDIRFRGRLEGIGATLQSSDDYTKVTSIVVGGPAWKGKELQEDDLIMAVRQDKDDDAVDTKSMALDDVVAMIRGKKGTVVHLTVKKTSGEIQQIQIERDVVVIDEKFARSLIIDGADEGEKIGYLYLPSFYADFQDPNGRFCSKDVAAELEKLKAAEVDGIVLDLRNNGGGSLADVVKMSGFFIPEGPIVQVQDRINNSEVLRDKDDRVQYDGPLAIMVNQYSASASEILAAALQDYNRAVIIGSTSTFGKGTVQRFIDLDRTLRGNAEIKPLGTIKLTMQKFFRINGGSTQLRGVVPDVILPDTYAYLETGEKKEANPMEWTSIDPVAFEQDVFNIENMDAIVANSKQRITTNETFTLIEENAKRIKRIRDRNTYSLNLEDYRTAEEALDKEAEKFKNMFDEALNEGVINLEVDLPAIEADESKVARNKEFIKDVTRDVYIHETLNIMHDLISGHKKALSQTERGE